MHYTSDWQVTGSSESAGLAIQKLAKHKMAVRWTILLLCVVSTAKGQNGYSRDNPSNQLGYNPFGQAITDENELNGDEIPGVAGEDYPIYSEVPRTSFSCSDQQYPGYYADPEAQCQAFYICQRGGGRGASFLCPNGTVFNQEFLVCDWWYNFDCNRAQGFYSVNEMIARAMEDADARLRLQQSGYNYDAPGSGQTQNSRYASNGGYNEVQVIGSSNNFQRPSAAYGAPNANNGNGNRYTDQSSNLRSGQNAISPVYGVPGGSEQPGLNEGNRLTSNRFNSGSRGFERSRQNIARPSQKYGAPERLTRPGQRNSLNNNVRFSGNRNGFSGGSPAPIYGPPSAGPSRLRDSGFQQFSSSNGEYNRNANIGNGGSAPDRTYLPPNSGSFNGNNEIRNDYRNANSLSVPDRTYLPPTSGNLINGNTGYNNGYANGNANFASAPDRTYLPPSSNGFNGQNEAFRNGLGNSPSPPGRSYLPPSGNGFSNVNAPSIQYGVPGQGSAFGNINSASPDRTYLPPS